MTGRIGSSLVLVSLVVATPLIGGRALAAPITYDFTSPAAAGLDGVTQGTLVVDGLPLVAEAGTVDASGSFTLGGLGAELCSDPLGLGVDTAGACNQVQVDTGGDPEAIRLRFDPAFIAESIDFVQAFGGEDITIWANDMTRAVFPGTGTTFGDVTTVPLPSGVSTVTVATFGPSDDADFFVRSVSGKPVPEPRAALVFAAGLGLVAWATRRRARHL